MLPGTQYDLPGTQPLLPGPEPILSGPQSNLPVAQDGSSQTALPGTQMLLLAMTVEQLERTFIPNATSPNSSTHNAEVRSSPVPRSMQRSNENVVPPLPLMLLHLSQSMYNDDPSAHVKNFAIVTRSQSPACFHESALSIRLVLQIHLFHQVLVLTCALLVDILRSRIWPSLNTRPSGQVMIQLKCVVVLVQDSWIQEHR